MIVLPALLLLASPPDSGLTILIFHGPTTASQLRAFGHLDADGDLHLIDVDADVPERYAAWLPKSASLPWVVVLPPRADPGTPPLWAGPFNPRALRVFFDQIPEIPEPIIAPHEAEPLPPPHEVDESSGMWAAMVLVALLLLMAVIRGVRK